MIDVCVSQFESYNKLKVIPWALGCKGPDENSLCCFLAILVNNHHRQCCYECCTIPVIHYWSGLSMQENLIVNDCCNKTIVPYLAAYGCSCRLLVS